jgi:hypothetical protein
VTPVLEAPVTVAVNWAVWPPMTVVDAGEIATWTGWTTIVAVALRDVSNVLVAMTWYVPGVTGAV